VYRARAEAGEAALNASIVAVRRIMYTSFSFKHSTWSVSVAPKECSGYFPPREATIKSHDGPVAH
jgi:hypothetical protein